MTIFEYIIYTLFFCLAPAGVIWACRRYKVLEKIGPIMVLYAIGMIVGNLPFLPEGLKVLQDMSVERKMTVVMITHNAALADMG